MNDLRAELLKAATGEILEIGFGSGLNLPFYPDETKRVVAVEPNQGMQRKARKRERASHVQVEWHFVKGEELPFPSASFDTVVSTLTLCSLRNASGVLAEIGRVLKPSGSFLFLEHGLDPNPKTQRFQKWIDPIQKRFADGCSLTLEIDKLISHNGFTIERMKTQHVRGPMNYKPYYWLGSARRDVAEIRIATA